jgi:hypothetical protein
LPKEITENTRSEIIYHLLSGYSYSEIIDVIGKSKGSITKIVQELELVHGKNNIDLLLSLAKSLKKEQLTPVQALMGIRIHSILKSLNCSEDYVAEFLLCNPTLLVRKIFILLLINVNCILSLFNYN